MPEPLVLLHGFTQTGRSWAGVVAALGERYRSLTPDLPGHGDASTRRPATIDACIAYLRGLRFDELVLGGYSMGGRIALHAALALPDRVRRLVLVSASPGLADPSERDARRDADAALAERIEAIGVPAFAREWARHPLFADQPRGVADLAHADRLRNTSAGLAASLRGMGAGAMTPVWDRLGELRMPVTLVAGSRDEKFTAIAERMAEAIPHAELIVVGYTGHAVHLEDPVAVAHIIAVGGSRAADE
jgi:2-succinyl-6-hydroxy-2,4-cyclohexadiene-1-carboxylate synthase